MKVLVAMSGGVDSSVAAAIMVAEGHDVVGVTLKLWQGPGGEAPVAGCCTVEDAEDARRVAARLDIPYYVLDHTGPFRSGVVDRFVSGYLEGTTPNPCVECNRSIKFSSLLAQARRLRCDLLATGHYARVDRAEGRWRLRRGLDRKKDQSYVLAMLGQEQLERVQFPVGVLTKTETREEAARLGLRTAAKPESQDICFVGPEGYRGFVRRRAPEASRPGSIVDRDGRVIGHHDGVAGFTVGQRRGLGVAAGTPRYVTAVDAATATITVGRREELLARGMTVSGVTWTAGHPAGSATAEVQIRAHGAPLPCEFSPMADGGLAIRFTRPEAAVAPGQAAVLYDGDEVLGGGTIVGVER
jgi:tRNA-specific 2-thiouridylase